MKKINQVIIFDPKPKATADEVMQILKMFAFQTYPPELRTKENLLALFDQLPPEAKRHFKVETPA